MKPSEIRDLKTEEIQSKMTDARQELMNLRFQQVSGQLTDTSRLRSIRRDIARYMTLLGERSELKTDVEGEA
jgi:large subunit ribosomal protein L29